MRWVNVRPGRRAAMLLGAIPLLAVLVAYLLASAARHTANPSDKLLPTPAAVTRASSASTRAPPMPPPT